jgi:UDP-N-acetylmuramoyl-tripeptide--D-alanyl-D-alanine ligase
MAFRLSDEEVILATGATRSGPEHQPDFGEVCTDSRAINPSSLFVALKGERFDAHAFLKEAAKRGAAGLVIHRHTAREAIPLGVAVYEVDDTLVALGQLARLHRRKFSIPLGAVTGSNGKTTTKELIASILSVRGPCLKTHGNLNNEIGLPLTLFGLEEAHVAGIVEMGMNHAGEIARLTAIAEPTAGLITVVQPAHLEGMGSLEGIALAKTELFRGLPASATAVINADDALIRNQAGGLACRTLTFGRSEGSDITLGATVARGRAGQLVSIAYRGKTYDVALQLVGAHNASNAAGAFALAVALGFEPDECVIGLNRARAHHRRLEILSAPRSVTVIDDCYNANPASMREGLRTLAQLAAGTRAVAVLGDMLELGAHEVDAHVELGKEAAAAAAVVAFFGPRTQVSAEVAAKISGSAVRHFDDVDKLWKWLEAELHAGDVVLVKGSRGMRLERVVDVLTGQTSGGH